MSDIKIPRRHALAISAMSLAGLALGRRLAWAVGEEPTPLTQPQERIVLKGVARSPGHAEGEALVSEQPLSWAPFAIPNESGVISIFEHPLKGQSVKDRIVVYPTVYGSTTGSIGLFFKVKESKVGPKAIICRHVHPIDIGGAIAAEIPAVDDLTEDPVHAIQTGDWVEIRADEVGKDATVTITRKNQRRRF